MSGKKWSILWISLYVVIMLLIGVMVVVVDPYFHYHAPIEGLSYSLENVFYINDGVSKNFSYNALITGTSVTRDFRVEEAGEVFDKEFVRLSFHGEGFKRIADNLNTALKSNPNLEVVIWGVDTMWFISGAEWQGYEEYPDYLFDDVIWNDVNYLYNKEILCNDVVPELVRTVEGISADTFDDYVTEQSSSSKAAVLESYERPEKEERIIEQTETDEFFEMLSHNLEQNILPVIRENPDVDFYIFFPPYSICWWDSINQAANGALMRRIDMEQFAIEKLLPYDNVRLFSFFNNFDLICDLSNYVDTVHYTGNVSSQILLWMKEGEYELTEENYMDYLRVIRDFYGNFDYDSIFDTADIETNQ